MQSKIEMRLGDITKIEVDAIVNAANEGLKRGGGVCGAIFAAAGAKELAAACDAIGHCDTGEAVITDGFRLPAKYIIHTPGPVWRGGDANEAKLLRASYRNSLELAAQNGVKSIAFPSISTGIFGYPVEEAAAIAVETARDFLAEGHEMEIIWVLFDEKTKAVYEKALAEVGK
ncbi:O-acetyl-ADP-ribose deacetylase [Aedoeadaptatus ivorii]|uniref:O-acetyl-ADP-ribose deacetylase n=1 Tax=Aedoeadaptatus ivorii TaxID=54006 RepID=A0A448V3G5_9FIRM|nr:macro domain-containing protein [Peptoniphilus ivorii]VEJ36344.1 O-acetyl-ADP-ribose deacetylase [Peptoniphilus ivorii]